MGCERKERFLLLKQVYIIASTSSIRIIVLDFFSKWWYTYLYPQTAQLDKPLQSRMDRYIEEEEKKFCNYEMMCAGTAKSALRRVQCSVVVV